MAVKKNYRNVGYGLNNALQSLANPPIVSQRAPTFSDFATEGTIWVDKSTGAYFVLTSIAGGQANWEGQTSGGSGTFSDVSVTGTSGTVLEVASGGNTVLGGNLNVTGTANLAATTITGNTSLTLSGSDSFAFSNTTGGSAVFSVEIADNDLTPNYELIKLKTFSSSGPMTSLILGHDSNTSAFIELGTDVGQTAVAIGNTAVGSSLNLSSNSPVLVNPSIQLGTISGPTITFGSGAPSGTPAQGSLYIRTGGTGGSQLLYVYDGSSWIAFTAA